MVFEYLEYDLAGLIHANAGGAGAGWTPLSDGAGALNGTVNITDVHVKSYLKQLLEGVHYMHKK